MGTKVGGLTGSHEDICQIHPVSQHHRVSGAGPVQADELCHAQCVTGDNGPHQGSRTSLAFHRCVTKRLGMEGDG